MGVGVDVGGVGVFCGEGGFEEVGGSGCVRVRGPEFRKEGGGGEGVEGGEAGHWWGGVWWWRR